MEGTVNLLCGRPEIGIGLFGLPKTLQLAQVNFCLLWQTVLAQVTVLGVDGRLATDAFCRLDCKHHETSLAGGGRWDEDFASVIALQKRFVDVINNGFEDSGQRLR